MSYVTDYTVVATGAPPAIVPAVDHADALRLFLANPRYQFENHKGAYDAADGEQITVLGYEQEAVADHYFATNRLVEARTMHTKGGKEPITRADIEKYKFESQERLREAEAAYKQTTVIFSVRHETVHEFDVVEIPVEVAA